MGPDPFQNMKPIEIQFVQSPQAEPKMLLLSFCDPGPAEKSQPTLS